MTKKLTEWEKRMNKERRSALLGIKHLLEDKSINVQCSMENHITRDHDGKIQYSGHHTITMTWWRVVKHNS